MKITFQTFWNSFKRHQTLARQQDERAEVHSEGDAPRKYTARGTILSIDNVRFSIPDEGNDDADWRQELYKTNNLVGIHDISDDDAKYQSSLAKNRSIGPGE